MLLLLAAVVLGQPADPCPPTEATVRAVQAEPRTPLFGSSLERARALSGDSWCFHCGSWDDEPDLYGVIEVIAPSSWERVVLRCRSKRAREPLRDKRSVTRVPAGDVCWLRLIGEARTERIRLAPREESVTCIAPRSR